jgi:peptidoglycan/xylan/chitin deacetylase (PgdA/CDA1 family)
MLNHFAGFTGKTIVLCGSLLLGMFSSGTAVAHWNLEEDYWEKRTQPAEIPAAVRPPAAHDIAADGPIYYTTGVRVLGYHDVFVEPNLSPTSDVVPDMFRDHMEFLDRAGYNVVTMSQVNAHITSGTPVPPNAVAITFDDDYRGQYWHAYPIMEGLGFKSTFYVHTNFVGVLTGKDHSTWGELAEMVGTGHDVQSHTLTHPNLANLGQPQLDNELFNSRQAIFDNLGIVADQICYPFGGYNTTVIQRSQAAGYLYGQTTIGGLNVPGTPAFETRRNLLGIGDTLSTFRNIMGYVGTDTSAPIIIDNTDPRFTISGTGFAVTGSTGSHRGQHGPNYVESLKLDGVAVFPGAPATTPRGAATWTYTAQTTGRYRVSAWWPGAANGAIGTNEQLRYIMRSPIQTTTADVQQNSAGKARWNTLNTIRVKSGDTVTVEVDNLRGTGESASSKVFADAVRFDPVPVQILTLLGINGEEVLSNRNAEVGNGTDFGPVTLNTPGLIREFTLNNPGTLPLTVTTATVTFGNSAVFSAIDSFPVIVPAGGSQPLRVLFRPTQIGIQNAHITLNSDDPDFPNFVLRMTGQGSGYESIDNFGTSVPASWEPLVSNVPGFTDNAYDGQSGALMSQTGADSLNRIRVAGWRSLSPSNLPISALTNQDLVVAKFAVYATGQADPSDHSQVPNLRMRVAQRFAVTSFQDLNHYSPADPEGNAFGNELRPSSDPLAPSIYRVIHAPVVVPYYATSTGEDIQRSFELIALSENQQGSIALTESSIMTMPTPTESSYTPPPGRVPFTSIQSYEVERNDFSSALINSVAFLQDPVAEPGFAPTLAPDTNGISSSFTPDQSLLLDTATAPTNRFNFAAADFIFGNSQGSNLTTRARIVPGQDYRARFIVGAEVSADQNAQIRMRVRTAKFNWSSSLIIGGAWAIGSDPAVGNAAIAQQALPGVGTRNPKTIFDRTNFAAYDFFLTNPLDVAIRPEFAPGTPIETRMPNLAAQDPPGVDTGGGSLAKSRRDILFGMDLIDTFSSGPRADEERGQAILRNIDLSSFPIVE